MILLEDIPCLKKNCDDNCIMDMDKKDDDNDSEEDILFNYERYNMECIRNEVIKDKNLLMKIPGTRNLILIYKIFDIKNGGIFKVL